MRPILSSAAALALTLTLASRASAQDVSYEKAKLPNGLTVILYEDHTLPTAAINLWYHVGSKDEAVHRSGFAHMFEHLMFMGTKRAPTGTFDSLMSAGGGSNNASTSEDRTNYHAHGPAELLPTLLWLDADRMEDLGANMTQEKLDKQRDVVRNERRQTHENRPYGKADMRLTELLYPEGHPYHISVIGTHEDLEAAQVQDVKDFFATYYVPNNCTLVVAGDFDPAKTKGLVAKLFGTIPRGGEPGHRVAAPVVLSQVVRTTMVDKVQQARITIAYHSPAKYAAGDAEMSLAAQVLTDGKTSRLYKRLVYDEKLCSSVRASQGSQQLGSVFQIDATPRPGADLDKVESIIDEELAKLAASGPTRDELDRRTSEIELGFLTRLQSIERVADKLNEYEAFFGEPNSFKRDLDRYRNATPEGVRDVARKYLTPDARVILRVLPEAPNHGESARDEQPPLRASGSAGEPRPAFEAPKPETVKLSNGLEVVVFKRPALPLVTATLVARSGYCLGDAAGKQAGLASLTAAMMKEGAGSLDALKFDEALQLLGARLTTGAGSDHATVSLTALKRNFDKASALMGDVVRRPHLDASDWERVKRLHLDGLRRRDDNPTNVATIVAARLLYGDKNPFAWPGEGTPESVKALKLDDVKLEHAVVFQPRNCTLIVAGDLTAAEAQAQFEKVFGDWKLDDHAEEPVGPRQVPDVTIPRSDKLRVVMVDRPDAVQTVVRFELPGARFGDQRRTALRLLNGVLGGGFSSRLNQNLRETHGYTYGASSRFGFGELTGTFVASSSVKAEVTGASLKEFLAEIAKIREGTNVTDVESSRAREMLHADMIHSTGELQGLIGVAAECVIHGVPFDAWAKDLAKIDTVKTADLNALAKDAIPLEQGVLVLVGDRKLIVEQCKGLGIPDPVEVDSSGQPVDPNHERAKPRERRGRGQRDPQGGDPAQPGPGNEHGQ